MQKCNNDPAAQADALLSILREQNAWKSLRKEIIARAVRFADSIVFDFRLLLTDPECTSQAASLMWQLIRPFKPQVLIGPGFGAAPLLFSIASAALADSVHVNILMVRDKRKEHNQKKWIEGRQQPEHSRAVMIDDFMEAGSALPLVEKALAADGHVLNLVAVALFFDMWQPLGSRQISTGRMPVISLFKRHDIGLSRDCFDAKPPNMKGSYPAFIDKEPLWWRFSLNDKKGYPLKCVPVIADNSIFVADDHSRVWRHDAYNGDIQWRYDSLVDPFKGIVQQLQYADDSIVFGCYDGTLTRLDADSGEIIWRWRLDSSIHATPELDLAKQRLFINTEQWNNGNPFGHLQALDWKTGKLLWRYVHPWWPPGTPVYSSHANIVIATCNDQSVIAVNADNGSLIWRNSSKGLVRGKPVIHGKNIFLATEKGWLQNFDLCSGEIRWEQRYGRGEMHQFLYVQGDSIYTMDGKWHFVALDVQSGAIIWMSRLRSAGNWCPVPCGRFLVVLSREGHLAVLDPIREIKVWEDSIGMYCRQPPAIGMLGNESVLAVASNTQGLKLYRIHSNYAEPTGTI